MIFQSYMTSRHECRAWLAGLVIIALAFRGLIPVGYMPNIERPANAPFGITICGGMAHHSQGSHDDQKLHKDHEACPFSVNAIFAYGGGDMGFAVPYVAFILLCAFSAFVLSRARRFGNVAPRGPPFCLA